MLLSFTGCDSSAGWITTEKADCYLFRKKEVIKKDKLTKEQKKIKELEVALKKEKNKALLYETIIEIAEEEYGIPIRKKSGAEQLEDLKKKRAKK